MKEIKENAFHFAISSRDGSDNFNMYQWTVFALLWLQENLMYLTRHPNVNISENKTTINIFASPEIISEKVQEDFNRCVRETDGEGKITYFLEGITILLKDGDAHF